MSTCSLMRRALDFIRHNGIFALFRNVKARLSFFFGRILKLSHVSSYYGLKFISTFGDRTFNYYILGSYGDFYSKHLQEYSKKFVFIDVGANQGLYSLIAAKNPNLKIAYAIEPFKPSYVRLVENPKLNSAGWKVATGNFAVGEISGLTKVKIRSGHSGAVTMRSVDLENLTDASDLIHVVNRHGLEELVTQREYNIFSQV